MNHMADLAQSAKFSHPARTADGSRRARVPMTSLQVLWFNTGTLCNLACDSCYIESSPRNDRLVYLSADEVAGFLDEIERDQLPVSMIGFTGGEPFMNPQLLDMIEDTVRRGLRVLVLSNGMKPMQHRQKRLLELHRAWPGMIEIRVSVDHHTRELHQSERGPTSWEPMIAGLRWLGENGLNFTLAGRLRWQEDEQEMRRGYQSLLTGLGLELDCSDPEKLVLFPEMDPARDVPEITESCWEILGIDPGSVMCSYSRMVVKRRGADRPVVLACTLIPYDASFELGTSLAQSQCSVSLNHPYCASFCVLGGATCGAAKA